MRSKFFSQLVDAAVSVPRRRAVSKKKEKEVLPELPKAPKVVKGPSEAELRERAEVEENHLRRLRMCFRDICNRWRPHLCIRWIVVMCGLIARDGGVQWSGLSVALSCLFFITWFCRVRCCLGSWVVGGRFVVCWVVDFSLFGGWGGVEL